MEIRNYSSPSSLHACETQVSVHYRHPPSTVESILLRCALETSGVRAQPPPEVRLAAYQDFAILYTIQFWIDDFARYQDIESDVLKRIWYLFRRENIQIPYPIREIYQREDGSRNETVADHIQFLQRIEFLSTLDDGQRSALAQRLAPQLFARGEIIFRQGEPGNTFHIIKSGQVEATVQNSDGHTIHGRVMKAGDYFGEVSLLTGEPRSATIRATEDTEVLTMGKEDMRRMLEANSQLAEHVSRTLTQRQQIIREQWTLPEQPEGHNGAIQEHHAESLRRELLGRIVRFFSY
jgi:CRP-like cAMP-binding protein